MNFSKLEHLIDTMPSRGIPFCDLAVSKDGKTVFRRSVGYSDAAEKKPVEATDLSWIFSVSKVITCVAAMRLIEEGKLRIDDHVSKYIPAFAQLQIKQWDGSLVPCQTAMTVEHLFTMTGGMAYNIRTAAIREARKAPNASTLSIVSAMAKDPLRFEPGTHYQYSLCHDVLAAVVEVASGMRFSEYLQKTIFDPLGMKDTGFRPTEEQKARFVATYRFDGVNNPPIPVPSENEFVFHPNYDSGGAGVFSCVDDYLKFATALACDGKAQNGYSLLRPETIAQMEVNRLCPAALKDFNAGRLYGYGWGLGCRVHMNPTVSLSLSGVGEFGWDGAAGASSIIDRANRVAIYFSMQVRGNSYAYNVLHPLIRNLVYEGLEE